jgi:poly(A) polymerase
MAHDDALVFTPPQTPPPGPNLEGAKTVVQRLVDHGHTAYFAGGFARDLLIGRPTHDIDIATSAPPDTVLLLFPESRAFGKSFGVVQVSQADQVYEVATFRVEADYTDGRRPDRVAFSNPHEDAQRRDFTINGLFYDPLAGQIIDYVGGSEDIRRRLVRAIGDPAQRFTEDHLRLLRAVRFASVLEFDLDPATADALRTFAPRLSSISAERIRDEFMRTLMEAPRPGAALHRLRDSGLLVEFFPELAALHGVEQPPQFHPEGDVFTHVALMLDLMDERSPELIWSILLHDIAKPHTYAILPDNRTGEPRITFRGHADRGAEMVAPIMRRFRCPNEVIDAVKVAVKYHMRFSAVPEMRPATLRRWIGAPTFPLELELHRIDCLGCHGSLAHYEQIRDLQETMAREPVLPAPLLTGRDLIAEGIPPGPQLGHALRRIYDAQLDGAFTDRAAALAWWHTHRHDEPPA